MLALLMWLAQDVAQDVAQGKLGKVKSRPKESKPKLFRVLVSTHRSGYLATNELGQDDTQAAEQESNVRWLIEQFHREASQLIGLQKYQCYLARGQRNPVALALHPWACLKRVAYRAETTACQLKQGLLDDYLHRKPTQPAWRFA